MERTARIISLEVWGNQEDGWEVNAAYRTNRFIMFEDVADSEALTRDNILEALCADHLDGQPSDYALEWTSEADITITDAADGRPVIDLAIG